MEPTLTDRILWTLLVGSAVAAATVLSRQGAAWLWRRARGTEPPKTIGPVESFARRRAGSAFDRRAWS